MLIGNWQFVKWWLRRFWAWLAGRSRCPTCRSSVPSECCCRGNAPHQWLMGASCQDPYHLDALYD